VKLHEYPRLKMYIPKKFNTVKCVKRFSGTYLKIPHFVIISKKYISVEEEGAGAGGNQEDLFLRQRVSRR